MYLIVNALAVMEHEIVIFFRPPWKANPYVTQIGMDYFLPLRVSASWRSRLGIIVVLVGQVLRSMAMIQASTNFSHMVAHQKVVGHRLVKEGVYAYAPVTVPLRVS